MGMAGLSVRNLHVFRGDRHVLRGLSFEVPRGRLLQVTGRNGAGKTTLLRSLCGLVEPEEGEVWWQGDRCRPGAPAFQQQMCYLGHEAPLKGDLTGRENLHYVIGIRRELGAGELAAGLERVAAGSFADRPVRSLSAGQRRRVALAGLWLSGAPLWILDEPTTNLDAEGQSLVAGLIEECVEAGGTVVAAVHHELAVAPARCDALVIG
jgi:heme exporter protein A